MKSLWIIIFAVFWPILVGFFGLNLGLILVKKRCFPIFGRFWNVLGLPKFVRGKMREISQLIAGNVFFVSLTKINANKYVTPEGATSKCKPGDCIVFTLECDLYPEYFV